jgi:pimeloyl-ACP methyl ester carboxylesterase
VEIAERTVQVAGLEVHYRQAGDAPILYLHGVPTHSYDWIPFLERVGGIAPDLPGFGRSAKPAEFDYSIAGYDRFIEAFAAELGLDRVSLVMHDWGGVGLAFAQRFPERIERIAMFPVVPFVLGYRWHRVGRGWRTPVVGELLMGFSPRWALRRAMPRELADAAWESFDHGTQRAILKLYRASPPEVLARAGEHLGELRAPALILWAEDDPYLPAKLARLLAEALGGETTLELVEGGHWTWHGRPELVERVAGFVAPPPIRPCAVG